MTLALFHFFWEVTAALKMAGMKRASRDEENGADRRTTNTTLGGFDDG